MLLLRIVSAFQFVLGFPLAFLASICVVFIPYHLTLGLLGEGPLKDLSQLGIGRLLFLQIIVGFVIWAGWGLLVFRMKWAQASIRHLAALSLLHHVAWMLVFGHLGSPILLLWLWSNVAIAIMTLGFYEGPEQLTA